MANSRLRKKSLSEQRVKILLIQREAGIFVHSLQQQFTNHLCTKPTHDHVQLMETQVSDACEQAKEFINRLTLRVLENELT